MDLAGLLLIVRKISDEGGGDKSHSSSPQSLGAVPPAAIHATSLGDVPHRFGELGQDAGIRKHRQACHGTVVAVRVEEALERRRAGVGRHLVHPLDDFRRQEAVGGGEAGEGVRRGQDGVGHLRSDGLAAGVARRCLEDALADHGGCLGAGFRWQVHVETARSGSFSSCDR